MDGEVEGGCRWGWVGLISLMGANLCISLLADIDAVIFEGFQGMG